MAGAPSLQPWLEPISIELEIEHTFLDGNELVPGWDGYGRGLGWLLMQTMIDYARAEGIRTINGQVLRENTTMLAMCKELGFQVKPDPDNFDIDVVELAVTGLPLKLSSGGMRC